MLAEMAAAKPPRATDRWIDEPRWRCRLSRGLARTSIAFATSWPSGFMACSRAQDSGGWRPHVTIQNKVSAKTARALAEELERNFAPAPLAIRGLALHRYLDGPWEEVATYPLSRLAEVADPVAAEVERGEAGFQHRSEHRLFQQFVDCAVRAFADERSAPPPSLRPSRPLRKSPDRPSRRRSLRPAGLRRDPRMPREALPRRCR